MGPPEQGTTRSKLMSSGLQRRAFHGVGPRPDFARPIRRC